MAVPNVVAKCDPMVGAWLAWFVASRPAHKALAQLN